VEKLIQDIFQIFPLTKTWNSDKIVSNLKRLKLERSPTFRRRPGRKLSCFLNHPNRSLGMNFSIV